MSRIRDIAIFYTMLYKVNIMYCAGWKPEDTHMMEKSILQ